MLDALAALEGWDVSDARIVTPTPVRVTEGPKSNSERSRAWRANRARKQASASDTNSDTNAVSLRVARHEKRHDRHDTQRVTNVSPLPPLGLSPLENSHKTSSSPTDSQNARETKTDTSDTQRNATNDTCRVVSRSEGGGGVFRAEKSETRLKTPKQRADAKDQEMAAKASAETQRLQDWAANGGQK